MSSIPSLKLMPSCGGRGVFTREDIAPGTKILAFKGPRVTIETIEAAESAGNRDLFLQIDREVYLGPSGGIDDFINHSCDPNCGLQFEGAEPYLAAIEHIAAGTELTFDYASTQEQYPYRFSCSCRSSKCRGEIGDFSELPPRTKQRYLELGIVPDFLIEDCSAEELEVPLHTLNGSGHK